MTRTIRIDEDIRTWLEAQTRAGETHNDVLRRIIGPDLVPAVQHGESATGADDQAAPDAADPPTA